MAVIVIPVALKDTILHKGREIRVERLESSGGTLNNLEDYDDTLFRDQHGRYYLRQIRMFKIPPNAGAKYDQLFDSICDGDAAPGVIERLRDWRLNLTKPRETIKPITEKTALLWCVNALLGDERLQEELKRAVLAGSKGAPARC